MILYNVTVAIDKTVENEWKIWMRSIHIPEVMATGQFLEHKFFKVMDTEPSEAASYSIQYFAEGMDNIQTYMAEHAPALQQKHLLKFQDKFAAFRTLLQSVE